MKTFSDLDKINYYCIKVKSDNEKNSFFILLLLFFKFVKNPNNSGELIFCGRPYLMLTKYPQNNVKNIGITESWELYEKAIHDHVEERIENIKKQDQQYISFSNDIYNKVYDTFYKEKKKYFNQKANNIEQVFGDLEIRISNILHYRAGNSFQRKIEVDLEEMGQKDFEDKAYNISSNNDENTQAESAPDEGAKTRLPISWLIGRNDKIDNYLPVISVNEGIICRKLNTGDQIMVFPETVTDVEDTQWLSKPPSEEYTPALIIDRMTTENRSQRFLILLKNGKYGDVEVHDDLIKIKTADTKKTTEPIERQKPILSWGTLVNLSLGVLLILLIYIFVSNL